MAVFLKIALVASSGVALKMNVLPFTNTALNEVCSKGDLTHKKFYGKEETTKFWLEDADNDTVELAYENGFVSCINGEDSSWNGKVKGIAWKKKTCKDPEVEDVRIRHLNASGKLCYTFFNFKKMKKQEQYQALNEWLDDMEQKGKEHCAATVIQEHWRRMHKKPYTERSSPLTFFGKGSSKDAKQ